MNLATAPGPAARAPACGAGSGGAGPLRSGDLVLDEERWTVHRAGTPVDLSPTEFRLLACLLRHQGTVVSRAQLLHTVWGWDYTGQPQVVETYVSYLRRKLGRLGPPLIYTCRGAGYVLRGPETPLTETTLTETPLTETTLTEDLNTGPVRSAR